ncbi:queuosine biosynthesis ATPase [Synechococcus phage Ssp-JY38]|nr:7-cyano-7-deazaguanine synthase [Synechococcus phage Yong-L2-223]
MEKHALVVMSGGQDSVTCLGVALKECHSVTALSFNYGQKHAVELDAARYICSLYGVPHDVIDLSPVLQSMRSSALVTHGDTTAPHPILSGLPASFVPARNALFLTAAYGIAIEKGATHIYTGVCQTDYSGYPDCREAFIKSLNVALDIGYESSIRIVTPLMHLNKAQTFALAQEVGVLSTVLKHSVTCYNGDIDTRHDWGRGCGTCPACELRAKGWREYKQSIEENANA